MINDETPIRISAKQLGETAMPTFCERCFWIKMRLRNRLPYQIFPSIFSKIDGYTKKVVHGYFDEKGEPLPWLDILGPIKSYIDPPTAHTFKQIVPGANVLLCGSPDAVFKRPDGKYIIVDYKTARFQGDDDPLLPMYHIQLNTYAWLWYEVYGGFVDRIALMYTVPQTDTESAQKPGQVTNSGFGMDFDVHLHELPLDYETLINQCLVAKHILSHDACPSGRDGCADCRKLDDLLALNPVAAKAAYCKNPSELASLGLQ